MASYWKSQPRKFCDVCRCWIGDNRASIDFHERGKSHQEKKKKQLDEIKKRSMQQAKENSKAGLYLKQMEEAARKSYLQDLKDQGIVKNKADEEKYLKKQAPIHTIPVEHKTVKPISKPSKPVVNLPSTSTSTIYNDSNAAAQNVKTENKFQPFGKWVTVESSTKIENEQTVPLIPVKAKPTEVKFTEKRVTTVDNDSVEPVAFKKRKPNSNKKVRSIRDRTES